MNIFVQGMRRSGTTILYDIFLEDREIDCYYEPLAAARETIGGGSGVRDFDLFEKVRSVREAFQSVYPDLEDIDLLNYGAPRKFELEFEPDLPDYCREYVKFLTTRAEHSAMKFTRVYCKVPVLHEIDPEAKFVQIVRDPRAVTTSYLFGKNRKNQHKFPNEKKFFRLRSKRMSWNSFHFSDHLLRTPQFAHLRRRENFFRILLLWKYTFARTHADGKRCFGDNFYLLRHEDLTSRPEETLKSLYQFLDRPLPRAVVDWAVQHVRSGRSHFAPESPMWNEAIEQLDLEQEMEAAGYSC